MPRQSTPSTCSMRLVASMYGATTADESGGRHDSPCSKPPCHNATPPSWSSELLGPLPACSIASLATVAAAELGTSLAISMYVSGFTSLEGVTTVGYRANSGRHSVAMLTRKRTPPIQKNVRINKCMEPSLELTWHRRGASDCCWSCHPPLRGECAARSRARAGSCASGSGCCRRGLQQAHAVSVAGHFHSRRRQSTWRTTRNRREQAHNVSTCSAVRALRRLVARMQSLPSSR